MPMNLAAGLRRLAARASAAAVIAVLAGTGAAGAGPDDPAVRIQAVAAQGGAPIQGGVHLQVWARQGKQATEKIAESERTPVSVPMSPGEYRVVARYKGTRIVRDIVVADRSDDRKTISFDIGEIELELLREVGGAAVRRGLTWTVLPYRQGGDAGQAVAESSEAAPSLALPQGWYKVVARHEGGRTAHLVEVAAGQRLTYALVLDEPG